MQHVVIRISRLQILCFFKQTTSAADQFKVKENKLTDVGSYVSWSMQAQTRVAAESHSRRTLRARTGDRFCGWHRSYLYWELPLPAPSIGVPRGVVGAPFGAD